MSAGLPWIQVQVGMPDHPKLRALALELGIDRAQAVGHAVVLWTSVGRLAPHGGLSTPHADQVLEQMSGWTGESGRFAAAVVVCGLVDRTETGLRIHDWDDHAGAFVEKCRRDAERKRLSRQASKRPADVQRTSSGHPSDVQREREREREREKISPAARAATDSQKAESRPSPEAVPPSRPRAQKQQKQHAPSAQEQIAQALAVARSRVHPDLTPWPVAEARFIKVVNKVFAAGSDIRTAHDADPKLFGLAWERYLADPWWKANGGWPLTGFLAKWREHLDSVRATQPSASFRNALQPGEMPVDPYAEPEDA